MYKAGAAELQPFREEQRLVKMTFNSQAKVIIFCWKHLIWICLWSLGTIFSVALGNEISIVKIKHGLTDFYIMVPENFKSSFDILTLMGRKAR